MYSKCSVFVSIFSRHEHFLQSNPIIPYDFVFDTWAKAASFHLLFRFSLNFAFSTFVWCGFSPPWMRRGFSPWKLLFFALLHKMGKHFAVAATHPHAQRCAFEECAIEVKREKTSTTATTQCLLDRLRNISWINQLESSLYHVHLSSVAMFWRELNFVQEHELWHSICYIMQWHYIDCKWFGIYSNGIPLPLYHLHLLLVWGKNTQKPIASDIQVDDSSSKYFASACSTHSTIQNRTRTWCVLSSPIVCVCAYLSTLYV